MSSAAAIREREHHCLPRGASACPMCGEALSIPTFCGTCGEDVTSHHICPPRPLPHVCATKSTRGVCIACGQQMPAAQFCTTCGAEITPSHRCPASPPTHVHRADPIHRCSVLEVKKCHSCGSLLPAMIFCADCGVDTTPSHCCPPKPESHTCPPLVTMPRRCFRCGELMPGARHCTQCGADITAEHVCTV